MWPAVAYVMCFQHLCKECGKWYTIKDGERHQLCDECNNKRKHPPSNPPPSISPVAASSASSVHTSTTLSHTHTHTHLSMEQRYNIIFLHRQGYTNDSISQHIP